MNKTEFIIFGKVQFIYLKYMFICIINTVILSILYHIHMIKSEKEEL